MGVWKTVFESQKMHEAEIVKGILMEHDIKVVLVNKQDSAYHLGLFEVMVEQDDIIKAIKIIQDEIRFK